MKNYIIEGEIDFLNEINNIKEDEEDKQDEQDKCLISGENLSDNYVTLLCNHKFNYKQLYYEIFNQKTGKNQVSYNMKFQSVNHITCPFCRNKQNKILPYIEEEIAETTYGVNYPFKYCMYNSTCKYKYISGKNKNNECGKECNGEYCLKHKKHMKKKAQQQIQDKSETKNIQEIKNIQETCKALIKHGKNAGNKCCFKAKYNGYCGKHTNSN